jgi:predicted enzyme related to lactoylglutathione lyase
MLEHTQAFGSYSVNDINAAKKFYGEVLGLEVRSEEVEGQELLGLKFENGTEVMIYAKPDHRPATFTVLNFPVPDVTTTVEELKKRGIHFEHYPGNDESEINHEGGMEVAWFKDPAGNFLSVLKEIH